MMTIYDKIEIALQRLTEACEAYNTNPTQFTLCQREAAQKWLEQLENKAISE